MQVSLKPELKIVYPNGIFGYLIARGVPNKRRHQDIEKKKRELENEIRISYPEVDEDEIIQGYEAYFKKWNRSYPIKYQIATIKGGRGFPKVSVLVDCMFIAELKNRVLTSGHDLDAIKSDPFFDLSDEGERYTKLNGKQQILKKNDVILRDEKGILASILYGPARRTSLQPDTKNSIYFAWCPNRIEPNRVKEHLNNICSNLEIVYKSFDYETEYLM